MDASGERWCAIIRVPKTGNVTRFEGPITAVTNAPDNGLRFSFQDVGATGLPDGVVDQSATIPMGSVAVGWANPGDFDAARAVTRGQYLALCVEFVTFVTGDSLAIGRGAAHAFPYGVTTATVKVGNKPVYALRYDDGTYGYLADDCWAVDASQATSIILDTGQTPDEAGLKFKFPFAARLIGVQIHMNPQNAGGLDIVLYAADGTVLETISHDGDYYLNGNESLTFLFSTAHSLTASAFYRIAVKPTTTQDTTFFYGVFNSGRIMWDTAGIPDDWGMTARTNAGTWTDYNNVTDGFRLPRISVMVDQIDFAAISQQPGIGSMLSLG